MQGEVIGQKDGFVLRFAAAGDAEAYFEQNYCPLDREVARLTGCKEEFTREEVLSFFRQAIQERDRAFFLIVAPDGRIVGESVINEMDRAVPCGGAGKGTWHLGHRADAGFCL